MTTNRRSGLHTAGGAEPVYETPGGGTFTAARFAEDNDGEQLDACVLGLKPGESITLPSADGPFEVRRVS